MKPLPLMFVALLASFPGAVTALLDPAPFQITFVLEARGVTIGETSWSLQRNGAGFVLQAHSEAAGIAALLGENSITERSEWKRVDDTFRPASYRYERTGKREKEISIAFDWSAGAVYNTAEGDTWRMEVPAGTVDKLGYLLELMEDLAAGERDVSYSIADGGKLKTYNLRVVGVETLQTEMGPMEALEVVRERPDSDRQTTFWMAPSLHFLPIRIEHREPDGESVTMNIRSLDTYGP